MGALKHGDLGAPEGGVSKSEGSDSYSRGGNSDSVSTSGYSDSVFAPDCGDLIIPLLVIYKQFPYLSHIIGVGGRWVAVTT